jgi:hypothetical protein
VIQVTRALAEVSLFYHSEDQDLVRILLNASSPAEANLAVVALRDFVPEKILVTAVNLREVLAALPTCPCAMPVEVTQLARIAGLRKVRNAYTRLFEDDGGHYELVVLGDGNLCYDIIVATEYGNVFMKPMPITTDLVHPDALELVMRHETLLDELISLTKSMGMLFNPPFYLSLEDWSMENAADAYEAFDEFF